MDFRPVEEGEDQSDSDGSHSEEAKEVDKTHVREGVMAERTAAGKKGFLRVFLNHCFHFPDQLSKIIHDFRSNRRNSQRIFTICQVRYSTETPVTGAVTNKPT